MSESVYLYIAIGGAAGATGRYYLSLWIANKSPGVFPSGTLVVNLLGCFLLGILYALGDKIISPQLRLFLATGLLGAFTTFSTFSVEALDLLRNGYPMIALSYLTASLVFGLLVAGLGIKLGSFLL